LIELTGRDYSVPMNEDVRNTLRQIRSTTRGGGHVFINPDTVKPYTGIKTVVGAACELAAIEICIGMICVTRSAVGSRKRVAVKRRLPI
jgi:hypothetical protein